MSDEPFARQDASDRLAAAPSGHPPAIPSGSPPVELALDLTREAVRLVARDAGGEWVELGAVPLAAGDFRAAIEALRQCAEALGPLPVTLWLPPDQILVRRYVLKRGDRGAEALRRLAEDTGQPARELTVALSPAADGELVTVLGASRRTVAEAVEYAGRWGFRPARVSTRVEAERFGTAGADFDMPEPATRGARIGARVALVAAAAMLAIGLGGWAAYGLLPPSDPGPSPGPSGPGPLALASAPEAATPHPEERGSEASPASSARLEVAPRDSSGAAPADLSQGRPAQAGASPAGDAVRPSEPAVAAAPDTPARLGRGSAPPERRSSVQRPRSAAPEAGADLGNLLAGIDRIRADDAGEEVAAPESPPDDEIVVAASDAAPLAVPGAPPPRPGDPDAAELAAKPVAGPDLELELEDDGIEAEGSDLPTPDIQVSDSRLATLEAPKPPARPERPARAEQAAAPRWQATPPRIGNAAAQGSMALDATSLIGVIDATSGRKALLRTPSGDFLKVARGDEVAGWRVNAIGQDAMRLTKGDESRTLLLVTR